MGDYDDPELTGDRQPAQRGRLLAVGAVIAALVVGLAIGYVVGGGTSQSPSVATVETAPEPTPTPEPTAPAVSGACADAGGAGAAVLAELERAVQAAGALDFGALREILDRVQPLQRELEVATAACTAGGAAPR